MCGEASVPSEDGKKSGVESVTGCGDVRPALRVDHKIYRSKQDEMTLRFKEKEHDQKLGELLSLT